MIRGLLALIAVGFVIPAAGQGTPPPPAAIAIKISNCLVTYDSEVMGQWPRGSTLSLSPPSITEVYISPASSGSWGEGLLSSKGRVIEPGDNQDFPVTSGSYDIRVIDEEGREYALYGVPISGAFCWPVTLDYLGESNYADHPDRLGAGVAPVVLIYCLDEDTDESNYWMWPEGRVFCSATSSSEWGESRGSLCLDQPLVFYVPANSRYDIRVSAWYNPVYGQREETFSKFEVLVGPAGYYWIVRARDMDD